MAKKRRGGIPGQMRGGQGGTNMNQMMQQAQKMQREMEKAQEEIAAMTIEATAGGGAVRVILNGNRQLTSLIIDPAVAQEDIEMLQDLVMVAVNDAQRQFDEQSEQRMSQVTGGSGLLPNL
jgi:nucleoid-associated protein EbfC